MAEEAASKPIAELKAQLDAALSETEQLKQEMQQAAEQADRRRREMLALGAEDTCAAPYAADPNLWLWDLACNVVAASAPAEHASVCTGSHLNPANFERLGARFAERAVAAAAGRPVVLGLQEWPAAASPKGEAFAAAFATTRPVWTISAQ